MSQETNPTTIDPTAGHYVYLYKDIRDHVLYVGYGRSTGRASSHLTGSHNEKLNRFLAEGKYRIDIAGPFEDERTGRAVETALISALKPEFNDNSGPSEWRFRPLGVPLQYADRLVDPKLSLRDFLTRQGNDATPVLFVIVNSSDFGDGRVGYDPANPPTDAQIRERVDRWWQLERYLPVWGMTRENSPGLLIGVFGSPGRQTVIASARIDRGAWAAAETRKEGKVRVPLVEPPDLDAFSLRGRRIAHEAGLMFGSWPAQCYILLSTNESVHGGLRRQN